MQDEYDPNEYEEEEEWDREGLLDPAWEKQQKKVGCAPSHLFLCVICKFMVYYLLQDFVFSSFGFILAKKSMYSVLFLKLLNGIQEDLTYKR